MTLDEIIECINEVKEDYWEDDGYGYATADCQRITTALDEVIERLEQTRWIPVSERLPKDNTLVLVTIKVGNREPKVRSGYYYMDGHFHIDNGDSWESRDKELLAWMPLPAPFEPQESEDKE